MKNIALRAWTSSHSVVCFLISHIHCCPRAFVTSHCLLNASDRLSLKNVALSLVHSIDADAQLSVNIKDTALTQAASFDVDADTDTGIGFISVPVSVSTSGVSVVL